MKSFIQIFALLLIVLLIVGGSCALKAYAWKDCLDHHSFLYCMATLK